MAQSLVTQPKSAPESGKVWGLHGYENFRYDDPLSVEWRNMSIKVCFHPHLLDINMSLEDDSVVSVFGLRSSGFKYIVKSFPNEKGITVAQLQDKICLRVTSILVSKTGPWSGPGEAAQGHVCCPTVGMVLGSAPGCASAWTPRRCQPTAQGTARPTRSSTTPFLHKGKKI